MFACTTNQKPRGSTACFHHDADDMSDAHVKIASEMAQKFGPRVLCVAADNFFLSIRVQSTAFELEVRASGLITG